jgi:hypothetical protein
VTISDNGELQILDEIFNAGVGTFPAGDPYIQLHSGDPGEAGTTNVVNVARVQAAFGAAAGGTLSNTGNIDFASMPAVTAPGVVGWSVWDAAGSGGPPTGGNCFWTGWFSTVGRVGVVDAAGITSNDIISPAHGFIADDRVVFEAIEGEATPTGIALGTLYFVLSAGLTTDTFNVSTSSGGGELDITAKGAVMARKVDGKTTNLNDTFRIATGDLDIYID